MIFNVGVGTASYLFGWRRGLLLLATTISLLALGLGLNARSAAADTLTAASPPPAVSRQISITDPTLGKLTFDALAAGNPEAAKSGKLVLFLHGFPETDESWREILPVIAAAGFYAVAPSQRGYSPGARPTAVADYALTNEVNDAMSMATALGANRFHLVGHDWGAAVGWLAAATHPDRLSSLAALSVPDSDALTEAYNDPAGQQKSMLTYLNVITIPGIQNVLWAFGPGFFALALKEMGLPADKANIYANAIGTSAVLGDAIDWYRANPIPSPQILGPITVPTLYMWGSKDFALSQEAALDTAKYVHAPYRFVQLDGIDHWIPENATARVAAEVLAQVTTTH